MDFTQLGTSANNNENMINVNGSDDPYYRYKMPAIKTESIHKKGGLTRWTNVREVSTAIYREPDQVKKYLSKKLGMPCVVEPAGAITFRGNVEQTVLQEHLMKYIKAEVLCKGCGSPETVNGRCQACMKKCK